MAQFSLKDAVVFEEGTRRFPGLPPEVTNIYSLATLTGNKHERLYLTTRGHWVLRSWTVELFAASPVFKRLSTKQAATWLLRNELPPHEVCAREYAALAKTYRPAAPPKLVLFPACVHTQAVAPKHKKRNARRAAA